MDAVAAASSPAHAVQCPLPSAGPRFPSSLPSRPCSRSRPHHPARPLQPVPLGSCFAAPKDLGWFFPAGCRVLPPLLGGSACGASLGLGGVSGGFAVPCGVPTGSRAPQAAVCRRNREKEEGDFTIPQMAAWGRGSGSAGRTWLRGADLGHAAGPQLFQTPPGPACAKPSVQTRAGHEEPSGPLASSITPQRQKLPWTGWPRADPRLPGGCQNPSARAWVAASLISRAPASAPQPSASPGCHPSQPHGRGPASLAPHKANEKSDGLGTSHHPWVPNTRRSSQGTEALPSPCSPLQSHLVPIPSTVFPLSVPHSPLGKATRGRGSAQSMAAGTTTPQSRRRAAAGMAGGGRLAPLGGPGTVPAGRGEG